VRRLLLGAGTLLLAMASLAGPCGATSVLATLGSAGPGNWGILVGPNTTDFALNGPGTTNGNVGYDGANSNQVQLNASNNAPIPNEAINGNLYLAPGDTVNNASQVGGSVVSNDAALGSAWSAALTASSTFSLMAADVSVPGGSVNGTTTVNSLCAGCTNVIDISSLNLGNGQTLTLNGSATDQFIVNVSGNFVLNSGRIVLTGGLTADDVVFNVTASGNAVQTSGGLNNESVVNGILLAPNSGIAFAPGLINGELIAGGQTVHLVSGANTNEVISIATIPEPSTYLLLAIGLMALGLFRPRRSTTCRRARP